MPNTQQYIYEIIREHGPISSWGVEHIAEAKRLNPTPSGVRSRIAELRKAGKVVDSGEREFTGRGNRTARLWKVS